MKQLIFCMALVASAVVALAADEIPKSEMTAFSSGDPGNPWGWTSDHAIDGDFNPPEWQSSFPAPQWLRLDLGEQYLVEEYGYARRTDHTDGYIRNFEIYVTDSDSTDPADWGTPVHTGTMPPDLPLGVEHRFALDNPSVGRYVILLGLDTYTSFVGAGEVWVYGSPPGFHIASFEVTDLDGSDVFTDSATVNVTLITAMGNAVAWQVTESDTEPTEWLDAVPTTYTITGYEGEVTIYAWAKDDLGNVAMKSDSIFYYDTAPAISDTQVVGQMPDSAVVYWRTSFVALSRVLWRETGSADEWSATDLSTELDTRHLHAITGLSADASYDIVLENNGFQSAPIAYTHSEWSAYIPKPNEGGDMSADADISPDIAFNAIDAVWPADYKRTTWNTWYNTDPHWLRIDLKSPYTVTRVDVDGLKGDHNFKDVEVFLTDSDSTDPADWGEPAGRATLPQSGARATVNTLGSGRYLIIYGDTWKYGAWVVEVWMWGNNHDPLVTDFALADQTSGSTSVTNDATVDLVATVDPGLDDIVGWLASEDPAEPDPATGAWSGTELTSYTITGGPGDATIYYWVKDAADKVAGASATILYQPAAPVMSNIKAFGQSDTSAGVSWTTDVACVGRVLYREQGTEDWLATELEPTPTTGHLRFLPGMTIGLTYEFKIESNEAESAVGTYTHLGGAPEIPKSRMTADASRFHDPNYKPEYAIDNLGTDWLAKYNDSTTRDWLRIDLGAPYRVQRIGLKGEKDSHGPDVVQFYVTDSDVVVPSGADPAPEWGTPVGSDDFPDPSIARRDTDLLGFGRYVIIYGTGQAHGFYIQEVWIYGSNMNPFINSFAAADQTSGSTMLTNEATVNISADVTPGIENIAAYAVTEGGAEPAPEDWQADNGRCRHRLQQPSADGPVVRCLRADRRLGPGELDHGHRFDRQGALPRRRHRNLAEHRTRNVPHIQPSQGHKRPRHRHDLRNESGEQRS